MMSITMSVSSRAAEILMRPRPSCSGGTAAIASVAFLMMLVRACEISRRSKRAGIGSSAVSTSISTSGWPTRIRNTTWRTVSARSSDVITGLGIRAKRENSSTMRLMSSTCRTMVSVHCTNTAGSSTITALYLRRRRSAESWIGVSGFLISWAIRRATSAQAELRCAITSSVMSSRVAT